MRKGRFYGMNKRSGVFVTVRSLIVSYIFTAAALFLLALLLYKLKLQQQIVSAGVMVIYGLACFLGGFLSGKGMRQQSFVWGLISGLCYFAVLFIVSLIISHGLYHSALTTVLAAAICLGAGAIGGTIS